MPDDDDPGAAQGGDEDRDSDHDGGAADPDARMPRPLSGLPGSGEPFPDMLSGAFTQGARFGEIMARVSLVEQRMDDHAALVEHSLQEIRHEMDTRFAALAVAMDKRHEQQTAQLARVVGYVDHQEKVEQEKKQKAEARDKQLQHIAETQRQVNVWLFPILGSILVTLLSLLFARFVQDVPRTLAYLGIGAGVVVLAVVLVVAWRRSVRANGGHGGGEDDGRGRNGT